MGRKQGAGPISCLIDFRDTRREDIKGRRAQGKKSTAEEPPSPRTTSRKRGIARKRSIKKNRHPPQGKSREEETEGWGGYTVFTQGVCGYGNRSRGGKRAESEAWALGEVSGCRRGATKSLSRMNAPEPRDIAAAKKAKGNGILRRGTVRERSKFCAKGKKQKPSTDQMPTRGRSSKKWIFQTQAITRKNCHTESEGFRESTTHPRMIL